MPERCALGKRNGENCPKYKDTRVTEVNEESECCFHEDEKSEREQKKWERRELIRQWKRMGGVWGTEEGKRELEELLADFEKEWEIPRPT